MPVTCISETLTNIGISKIGVTFLQGVTNLTAYFELSCRHAGASTASRKSQGASVMKSKYGKVGGTTYNSSRTNIPLSASKTRTDKQAEKPPRAPVQVRLNSHTVKFLNFRT